MRLLRGALFHTCDPDHPVTHALGCDETGTIVALGNEALGNGAHSDVVELTGWATPGLTDAHVHLLLMARAACDIDVSAARTDDEVIACLNKPRDGWLVGRGLSFALSPNALDRAFPTMPVAVRRLDEHCGVFNSAAIGQAGWLYEQAFDRAMQRVPQPRLDVAREAAKLRALGITHVHELAAQEHELPLLRNLAVSVTPYLYSDELETYLRWCREGLPPARGIKVFLDGALGSRGARLLQPYSDDPCTHGLHYMQGVDRIVEAAAGAGISVAMHAIGDAAVRDALDLIERYRPPLARIEHAQVVDPADLARFNGVFAGVQFVHQHEDEPFTAARLGARSAHAHAWTALRDAGAILVAGSDAPIADPTPALALASRRGLSRQEALSAYTFNAARAAGEHRGQLRVGMPCELTLWHNDPLTAETPSIAGVFP